MSEFILNLSTVLIIAGCVYVVANSIVFVVKKYNEDHEDFK